MQAAYGGSPQRAGMAGPGSLDDLMSGLHEWRNIQVSGVAITPAVAVAGSRDHARVHEDSRPPAVAVCMRLRVRIRDKDHLCV